MRVACGAFFFCGVWKISRTNRGATKLQAYDKPMRLLAWNGLLLVSEWTYGIFLLGADGTQLAQYGGRRNDFMAGIWRANEPPLPANASLVEPANGALLVAADDACVYYTTNDQIVRMPK